MTSINKFDSNVYSDELHSVSESEYDDVMQMMADENFNGYSEWSAGLDIVNESENFYVTSDGKAHHKGANLKSNRIGGIEI